MLKKILLVALPGCFAMAANAQIATPNLDQGFHTFSAAATGWRNNGTISLDGFRLEGDVKVNEENEGDAEGGMAADGPDESGSSPHLLGVYKAETWAAELWSATSNGINSDAEFDLPGGMISDQVISSAQTNNLSAIQATAKIAGIPHLEEDNIYEEEKNMRLSFAYILGEVLSVGVGYRTLGHKKEETVKGPIIIDGHPDPNVFFPVKAAFTKTTESESTTTGLAATASWKLADIFYLAGGMESVTKTGTVKSEQNTVVGTAVVDKSSTDKDYVENSWNNTMLGVGLVTGEPDGTQFKLEWSMINSPKSVENPSEGDADKEEASLHPKTVTTFITAEAKWNDIVFGYHREVETEEKLKELADQESETIVTQFGVGWQPLEGLSVSFYSLAQEKTVKKPDMGQATTSPVVDEIVSDSKGWRFFVGYNF